MGVVFFLMRLGGGKPTTSPHIFTSGPPLLPGLMGVSVWIHVPGPASRNLPPALTIPLLMLNCMASPGLPMAKTLSPCERFAHRRARDAENLRRQLFQS